MHEFVRTVATELPATLHAASLDSYGFVKAIMAQPLWYARAKQSLYGVQPVRWWKQVSRRDNRTSPFWRYVSRVPRLPV